MSYQIGDRVTFEWQGKREGEIIEIKAELALVKVETERSTWRIWQHVLRLTRCNLNLKELTNELEREIK